MSEQIKDTFLNSLTDDLAESFFDGGASSKNVVTATEGVKAEDSKEGEKAKDKEDLDTFSKSTDFSAADVLGDRLDSEEKTVDFTQKLSAPDEKPKKVEEDYSFLVDEGILSGFADDAPIKSKKDLEQLIKGNKEQWVTEAKTSAEKELQDGLPEEVKFLIDYAKKGGDDLKSVFKLLSQTQEFKDYDIEKDEDAKNLIRAYYDNQGWSSEEVEEEIINLVESNRVKSQAQKMKPKLDRINQDQLEQKKQEQAYIEEQHTKAKQFFTENVVTALKPGKLGDIKLTKDEQLDIYNALVKESYQSISGKTNRLGALLDRIQYVKPDYELLAKVTMYLSNPVEFEKRLRDNMKIDVTAEQVRKIKTEQQKQNIGSSHNPEKENKKLPKLGTGFINNPF